MCIIILPMRATCTTPARC